MKLTRYTYRHPTLGDKAIVLTDDNREAWCGMDGTWIVDDEPTRIVHPIVAVEEITTCPVCNVTLEE